MIRTIFLFILIGLFMGCNPEVKEAKKQLKDDVKELIELELLVIEKSKVLNKDSENAELKKELDSLSNLLRTKGIELRQSYQEKEMVDQYEEVYKKMKKEMTK